MQHLLDHQHVRVNRSEGRRPRWVRGVVAVALAAATAACGSPDEAQGGGGSDLARRLYKQATEAGYEGQARLLEDGEVSLAELKEANLALIACAAERDVALVAYDSEDERGPYNMVEPADTTSKVDAEHVNAVIDACQTREQMLVGRLYVEQLPEMSDRGYALWVDCARELGFKGELPRSLGKIANVLDADDNYECTQQVSAALEKL